MIRTRPASNAPQQSAPKGSVILAPAFLPLTVANVESGRCLCGGMVRYDPQVETLALRGLRLRRFACALCARDLYVEPGGAL